MMLPIAGMGLGIYTARGAVPGRGLNKNSFWGGEREFPGIDRKLKKIIVLT